MSSVYTGLWVNWSHGRIHGTTLTLNERDGGLLTAFLALFVSVAGAATWKITCYAIHQRQARPTAEDALHHQQQAILCNSATPFGASWQFMQLVWYWKKHAVNAFKRTILLIVLASLNLTLFGVASVFSSEVTKGAGNETLILPSGCGLLNYSTENWAALTSGRTVPLTYTISASTYASACYGDSPDPLRCYQYPVPKLPWQSNANVTCPFASEICMYGDKPAAYEMDTQLLDSHHHFGINAPPKNRIQYRKVTTCSPIQTKGFSDRYNVTDPELAAYGDTIERYQYGGSGNLNYTHMYNTHGALVDNYGYALWTIFGSTGRGVVEGWDPIPALNRTDADVSLFLLAPNAILYDAPVYDPFFKATTVFSSSPNEDGSNQTLYTADHYMDALACAEQHQICNPELNQCTPLTSPGGIKQALYDLVLNGHQMATVMRLWDNMQHINLHNSVLTRGASALKASDTVSNVVNVGLPNNQWHIEVSSWFAVSMAKLQQLMVDYATGPGYALPDAVTLIPPEYKESEEMCESQIIRSSTGTLPFSVLGVAIILIVGSLLIFTSLVIDIVMGFIRKWSHWDEHKSLQWTLNDKLQLQRMAFEGVGQGHWTGGMDVVPMTRWAERLGGEYGGVEAGHPRLRRGLPTHTPYDSEGSTVSPEVEALTEKKQPQEKVQEVH